MSEVQGAGRRRIQSGTFSHLGSNRFEHIAGLPRAACAAHVRVTEEYWMNAMAWLYLVIAGVLEIVWAIGLKYTDGFSRLVPSLITIAAMIASVWFLALALRVIPVGTGYAVWTGIGAVGTAILGIALLGEPATIARLASIGLIVAGIVGLKLVS
jgi:quaternary ammonium compound-resistance protein SugE